MDWACLEHGLWVYNGGYLELALRREFSLASRDEALCKAARSCRVKPLLQQLGARAGRLDTVPGEGQGRMGTWPKVYQNFTEFDRI
jgi:hypothetical protein